MKYAVFVDVEEEQNLFKYPLQWAKDMFYLDIDLSQLYE